MTVARWSELRVPVLMTFYRRYWKRALSRGRLTRNTFSFSLTHLLTYTHTQTRVHLHAKLLCSSCTSLPDSLGVNIMPPSLVQACMWCFYLLGDVYSFLCVCARVCVRVCSCPMRVCLYVDVAFHWVSSLPSETQAREEDHSAFSPSYCHLTQWMMHCSQTHTCRAHGGTRAAQTGTHGLGCVSAWAFVLCTCCFKTNVRELQ